MGDCDEIYGYGGGHVGSVDVEREREGDGLEARLYKERD